MDPLEFFGSAYFGSSRECTRFKLGGIIGKGSYGTVVSALDLSTGEQVAIKKITSVFEHVSGEIDRLMQLRCIHVQASGVLYIQYYVRMYVHVRAHMQMPSIFKVLCARTRTAGRRRDRPVPVRYVYMHVHIVN